MRKFNAILDVAWFLTLTACAHVLHQLLDWVANRRSQVLQQLHQ
ncbi:hypothetical protein [Lacticaseibacillus sp. GG6-2]